MFFLWSNEKLNSSSSSGVGGKMVEFKNSLYDNVLVVELVSETQEYIEGEIFYFSIDNFCFSVYNVIRMRALLP